MDEQDHKRQCLQRWQDLEAEARKKWGDYRRRRISRRQLEGWLKEQSEMDERTIRAIYNGMRG